MLWVKNADFEEGHTASLWHAVLVLREGIKQMARRRHAARQFVLRGAVANSVPVVKDYS